MDEGRIFLDVVDMAERDRVGREGAVLGDEGVLDCWMPACDNFEGRAARRNAAVVRPASSTVRAGEECAPRVNLRTDPTVLLGHLCKAHDDIELGERVRRMQQAVVVLQHLRERACARNERRVRKRR